MKFYYYSFILTILILSIKGQILAQISDTSILENIAFGSCSHQDKKQKILYSVIEQSPDIFVYLGDNIYGDSRYINVIKEKYTKLGSKKEFQSLKNACKVLATWDDHDYGWNDAGRHYSLKTESREAFLNFWEEPKSSERWSHKGIYHSEIYGPIGKRVQIILLDTRTFRDNLIWENNSGPGKNAYVPNQNSDSTFLGNLQWEWLEQQFQKDAEIRIVASSNQFSHEYNGHESWTNVPHERKKMLELIKKHKVEGLLFISGDVHYGEISKLETEGLYPIYDITSSGLTQRWHNTSPNKNRIGKAVRKNNFGLLQFDWGENPFIRMKILNKKGKVKSANVIMLSDLTF